MRNLRVLNVGTAFFEALDNAWNLYSFIRRAPNRPCFASGLGLCVLLLSWVGYSEKLTFAPCVLHSSTVWLLLSPCSSSSSFFTSSPLQRWNPPLPKVPMLYL